MLNLSDLFQFHSGQVKTFYLLVRINKVDAILHFILINYYELPMQCCIENSVDPDQLASSDLHCFQLSLYLVSYCF